MRFQAYIDAVPAGQSFDADDASAALAEASDRYDGMLVAGATHGESITVDPVTVTLNGRQVPLAEASVTLGIPEGACAGCYLGDDGPSMHDYGYGCEYGKGAVA